MIDGIIYISDLPYLFMVKFNTRTFCDVCGKEIVGIEKNWRGEIELKVPMDGFEYLGKKERELPLDSFVSMGVEIPKEFVGRKFLDIVEHLNKYYHLDCYIKKKVSDHEFEFDWVKMLQNKIDKGETDFKDFFKMFDKIQSADEHTDVLKSKLMKMVTKVKND